MYEDLYSAFFTEGYVGHLSYVLLIVSMMMRNIVWLRVLAVTSALAGIAYDLFWLYNPVGVFWESLFLAVNLVQLYVLWRRDRRATFSDEETDFVSRRMRSGSAGMHRLILDLGRWDDLAPGQVLTVEGRQPTCLVYLSAGTVEIEVGGQTLAELGPGHFVGEMSLIGDGQASATVRVATPVRAWRIDRARLERLRQGQPELFGVIEAAIALDLRTKIIDGNRRAAGETVAPAP